MCEFISCALINDVDCALDKGELNLPNIKFGKFNSPFLGY